MNKQFYAVPKEGWIDLEVECGYMGDSSSDGYDFDILLTCEEAERLIAVLQSILPYAHNMNKEESK